MNAAVSTKQIKQAKTKAQQEAKPQLVVASVLIQHAVRYNSTTGAAEVVRTKPDAVLPIKARYLSGKVQTGNGDIWQVVAAEGKHAGKFYQFVTTG